MVSLRTAAFVFGAIGLALFLAGIMWALLASPDPTCTDPKLKGVACEKHNYGALITKVMLVMGAGLLIESAAVVMLLMDMSKARARPATPQPPTGKQYRPTGPATGAAQPGATQGPPRNRFLEPPVPPRGQNGKGSS